MIKLKAGSLRAIDLGKKVKLEPTPTKFITVVLHAVEHRTSPGDHGWTFINGHRVSSETFVVLGTEQPACGHEHKTP